MKGYISLILLCTLVIGCNSLPDKKLLKESEAFKLQIEEQLDVIRPQLQTLIQRANSINIQGRALSIDEIEFTARSSGIEQSFADWEQQYTSAHLLLKKEEVSAANLWDGYQQSQKELSILQKRIQELLN